MKHYFSIGMTVAAGALSLAALPLIADAASSRHTQSQWAQHAWQFDAIAAPNAAQGYAAKLSSVHAASANLTHWQRDAAQTAQIKQIDIGLIDQADTKTAQAQCLAEAVYYEARSETLAGQKAVAEVVMNRVASKHFPNSICAVVYEGSERSTGCQFSFTCDGSLDLAPKAASWENSQQVAQHVLIGAHKSMTQRATHYHTIAINPGWASYVKPTRTIGSHKFYKFKSRRELAMTESVAP